jgi:circadian clock protein KaiC
VLYISFEESEAALVSTVRNCGIDLHPAIAAGTLHFLTAIPEAMGAEQHLVRAFTAIQQLQPSCVVLESASACKRMGTEQAAFEYLMRLINACKEKGITILTTNQTAGYMNFEEVSGIDISSITDSIIILRVVEEDGALQRKLLVAKARGSRHSNRFHNVAITDQGIDISREDA